jgi:phosphohistidine phosphatase
VNHQLPGQVRESRAADRHILEKSRTVVGPPPLSRILSSIARVHYSFNCSRPPDGMDILLLRHGKAGKRKEYTGNDRFRPLTDEGIQDLILIAGWLRRQFPDPGVIATSPLTRASQTAEIVAKELHVHRALETWDELSPGNDNEALFRRLERVPEAGTIMLVGHEPDLSKFGAFVLTGRNDSFFTLSKGGLAVLKDVNPGQAGSGSLYLLMPARLMR